MVGREAGGWELVRLPCSPSGSWVGHLHISAVPVSALAPPLASWEMVLDWCLVGVGQ